LTGGNQIKSDAVIPVTNPSQEDKMRKLTYGLSVSVDGFIETLSGDLNWTYPDAEWYQHFIEMESTIDTYLYGRRLYENMAAYWPTADENPEAPEFEIEFARIWKAKKKIVFSKTLTEVGWNSELFKGDIAEGINRMKAQPGKDMIVAGANLAATFIRLGLIDEYRLYIHPVLLGSGKPMFPPLPDRINLKLVETRTFGSGAVLLRLASQGAA
jgi:dihydrofolate reductase